MEKQTGKEKLQKKKKKKKNITTSKTGTGLNFIQDIWPLSDSAAVPSNKMFNAKLNQSAYFLRQTSLLSNLSINI